MTQFLSPEKYIRQRARTLPIHECLVNDEWNQNQLATVFIVRKHVNGHFTIGNYLVDLKCLGVKDTFFWFNVSADDYEDLKDDLFSKQEMSVISYELAHNIVFAGENFATEIGLKSHPDFYKTTQFILEEDNDNIELIDIEVGDNGVPVFVQGPYDTPDRVYEILETLNKTVGNGNYHYVDVSELDSEIDSDDDDDNDNDDDNRFEKYLAYSFNDLKNLLLNFETIAVTNFGEHSLTGITTSLIYRIEGDRKIDNLFAQLSELLDFKVDVDEVHPSLFGLDSFDDRYNKEDLTNDFVDACKNLSEKKVGKKLIEDFAKKFPEIPANTYLLAQTEFTKDKNNSSSVVEKYALSCPDYPLIQLLFSVASLLNTPADDNLDFPEFYSAWFGSRKVLHPIEATDYIFYLSTFVFKKENLAWGLAFIEALEESDIPVEIVHYYRTIGFLSLVIILRDRLSTEDFSHLK
ncbi:MAG: hypothetical protein RB294_04885 [Bacteroidales bacterium]|jgi:hypothetical protein|nr:hypothetical protein [Bacteroidales bacterium]